VRACCPNSFGARSPLRAGVNLWCTADGEIAFDAPCHRLLSRGQVAPELCSRLLRIGKDQPADLAPAHQAVVPTEIVVEQQVEGRPLPRPQGLDGPLLYLGLQATATQRAFDTPIGIKQGLGADLLRAGPLHVGDDAQRDRLPAARRLCQGLEDNVSHEPEKSNSSRLRSRGRRLMACSECGNRPSPPAGAEGPRMAGQARCPRDILYCSSILPVLFLYSSCSLGPLSSFCALRARRGLRPQGAPRVESPTIDGPGLAAIQRPAHFAFRPSLASLAYIARSGGGWPRPREPKCYPQCPVSLPGSNNRFGLCH
jgi:hypothetical protein